MIRHFSITFPLPDYMKFLVIAFAMLFIQGTKAQQDSLFAAKDAVIGHYDKVVLDKLPDTIINLVPFTSIYIDKKTGLNIDAVQNLWRSSRFSPLSDVIYPPKLESGSYHYWLQFQLENVTKDTMDLILRLPRMDSSFYYQITDNKIDTNFWFGNKIPYQELLNFKMDVADIAAMPMRLLPQTSYQIFIRTSDNLYLTAKITPSLQSYYFHLKFSANRHFGRIFSDSFFLGILFFIAVFSFFQFSQNRDKAFLYYALYVGLTFLFNWLEFEYDSVAIKIFRYWISDKNYIKIPLDVAMFSAYLLFVHYFINEKNEYPILSKFIKTLLYFCGVYVCIAVLLTLIDIRWGWYLHYIFLLVIIITGWILLYFFWKINTRLSRYLFYGALCLTIFVVLVPAFFLLNFVDEVAWITKDIPLVSSQIGVLVELLFFSLGLGYKSHLAEQKKLEAQKEKLEMEAIKGFKDQLYTNLTHEFRTPLTIILGMTDVIETNIENKKWHNTTQSLSMIKRNGENLLQLVNQMLEMARLDSGQLDLELIQSDIIPFIKYLGESFQSLAEKKEIKLTIYAETEKLIMDFDASKMTTIISNLLSNAIKFTPKRGKIIVHLNQKTIEEQEFLLIKVKDTGIGISEEKLPYIFDRFYQVDSSASREQQGTGIGLALTKELIILMQGHIKVKSNLGKGSEFIVQIPIGKTAPFSKEIQHSTLLSVQQSKIRELPDIPISKISTEQPSVLIIEDNFDVVYYLKSCLRDKYKCLHAENGKIGIEMAFEKMPDLIICDVMMPEKDGYEVCQILKTNEQTDHIPIIMLTAKASFEDRLIGLSYGADAYLAKPFVKAELFTRLEQLILLRQKLQFKLQKEGFSGFLNQKAKTPETRFLQKTVKIIHAHIDSPDLGVAYLARKLALSESQVYRKLKAITGKSTALFIRFVRLQKAKELLQTTDKPVSEIAYETGFKDPSWFTRVFKEEFGFTPNAMRK